MANKKKNNYDWNMPKDKRIEGDIVTAETKRHKAIYRTFGAMPVVVVATTQAFQTSGLKSAIAGLTAVLATTVVGQGIESWHRNQEEVMNLQGDEIIEAKKSRTSDKKKNRGVVGLEDVSYSKILHGGIAAAGATVSGCMAAAFPQIFKIGVETVSKGTGAELAVFALGVLATLYGAAEFANDLPKQKRLKLKANPWKYV